MGRLVAGRLNEALRAFRERDMAAAEGVIEGDDVFDALNLTIEERAFSLASGPSHTPEITRFLRSAPKVSANLERIGDAACHIARRVGISYYEQAEFTDFHMGEMEPIALAAIRESVDGYLDQDLQLARAACLREPQLDTIYREKLGQVQRRLRTETHHVNFLLYWYSVLKYMEKVCDYTLNIGEQAIFLITGRRLKFAQYQQLDRLVSPHTADRYSFHAYYDGMSGASVARLENRSEAMIYKAGSKRKIAAEADKLRQWQEVSPSLAPRVIATHSVGDREALLREFVRGDLLSELYFSERNIEDKETVTTALLDTLTEMWEFTLRADEPAVDYSGEIESRLSEVYAMHPYLEYVAAQEGLADLLGLARQRESALAPPFCVWLHGDFNVNNVMHDGHDIKFIDIHRSHYGDYLTDVGVFLVSIVRQPRLSQQTRSDMATVWNMVCEAAVSFGRTKGDVACAQRLNLSLARSYITSARIIVDEAHARWLFQQGTNLLTRELVA